MYLRKAHDLILSLRISVESFANHLSLCEFQMSLPFMPPSSRVIPTRSSFILNYNKFSFSGIILSFVTIFVVNLLYQIYYLFISNQIVKMVKVVNFVKMVKIVKVVNFVVKNEH